MSKFKTKKFVSNDNISLVNPNILRPAQHQYLYQAPLDAVTDSYKKADDRIIITDAPTNSGKSFVLVNVLIPALIQQNPHTESVVFTSPDAGCVTGPYNKFKARWHDKVISNRLGNHVRIRVINKTEFNEDLVSDKEFVSVEQVVEVLFITTQMLGSKWKDYTDNKKKEKDLTPPTFVVVDEIHYGMGTVSWESIMADQGRSNKNYAPHWLPILVALSKAGSRVLGFTGTPTNSQLGLSVHGKPVFIKLPSMPKNKDATSFVDSWMSTNPDEVYRHSKKVIANDLVTLKSLMYNITDDTWDNAKTIGITKKMPGSFFKFGRRNSANGVVLESNVDEFKGWASRSGADCGVATCKEKEYHTAYKPGDSSRYKYPYLKSSFDVVDSANSEANFSHPVFIAVINSGNMGWDIPRLKYISMLTHPSGKEVTNMQQQVMSRGNRMPFENTHSHIDKANEIAALPVSIEQRKLLAEYVVFMSSTVVFISSESDLLVSAYDKFKLTTHSSEEGMKIYMDAIDNHVPKKNVVTFKAPRFTVGYSAGSKNQSYKNHFCEACMTAGSFDKLTGKTICEVESRKVREFERGQAFSDAEWKETWFHTLVLDHKFGDRNDYTQSHLITRCPTNNGVKTYDAKDYLNSYDDKGSLFGLALG
jgi:hypothetical protein